MANDIVSIIWLHLMLYLPLKKFSRQFLDVQCAHCATDEFRPRGRASLLKIMLKILQRYHCVKWF